MTAAQWLAEQAAERARVAALPETRQTAIRYQLNALDESEAALLKRLEIIKTTRVQLLDEWHDLEAKKGKAE